MTPGAFMGGLHGRYESLLEGAAGVLDAAARARQTGLARPLHTWVLLSLFGIVLSVVLLGHIAETQPYFYAVMGLSLVVYALVRGESLASALVQYLTSPTVVWRWAFVVWAILSLLWTARGGLSVERATTLLEIQIVGLVFYDATRNLGLARWMLGVVLACTAAAALHAVTTEDPMVALRLAGAYRNPNTLGIVAVTGMAVCGSWIGDLKRAWQVLVGYLVIMLLAVGVLASSSLKGITGTGFVLGSSMFYPRARARIALLAAIGAVVVTVLVLTFEPMTLLWEHTVDRVEVTVTTFETAADVGQSLAERSRFIGKGLELMAEAPFVGTGLNTFRWLSDEGTYSHNNFVELGVSLGIVGVLLYYAFHVSLLARAFAPGNRTRLVGRFAIMFILMMAVLDMASVSYAHKLSSLLMIACAGWLDGSAAGGTASAPSREEVHAQ